MSFYSLVALKSSPREKKQVQTLIQRQWSFLILRSVICNNNLQQERDLKSLVETLQFLADPRTHTIANALDLPQERDIATLTKTQVLPHRKFLILINPVSGKGKAKQMYHTHVEPYLRQAQIETEAIVTERRGHALDIIKKMPLKKYDCVVIVGGDGLLSEIVHGLTSRYDWEQAILQPIGTLPGGSGNGLCSSLLYQSCEDLKINNATYMLIKGMPEKLDLTCVKITRVNGEINTMYSFLSLEWAFIADVDIKSEKFRALGDIRFTMAALIKIIAGRKFYRGKLRYKSLEQHHENEWKEYNGPFTLFWAMNVSHAAQNALIARDARMNDGSVHLVIVDGKHSRAKLVPLLLAAEDGTFTDKAIVQVIKTSAFVLEVDKHDDLLCIDGEAIFGPKIEIQVLPGLARVISLPPFSATSE